ncbi:uncharacterized protein PAF06_013597 [Gastrophryne carolinensis]
MGGVSGAITINTDAGTLGANLTGACAPLLISIHQFPVIFGASHDPCDAALIGSPIGDNFTLPSGVAQVAINRSVGYDGRPVVIETCGRRMCVNLLGDAHQSWRAPIQSFLIGRVYMVQSSPLQPLVALAELALLEGSPASRASVFLSDGCRVTDLQPLGSVEVGQTPNLARSRAELGAVSPMRFLILQYQDRWACVELREIQGKEASALFSAKGVSGSVVLRQQSPFHPTQLAVDLRGLGAVAGHYGIHALPILPNQQCNEAGTGRVWNPLEANAPTALSVHHSWPIGDLSRRHGALQGQDRYNAILTDWNLPLFGNNSVVGRSLVIQTSSGEPWVCAGIRPGGDVVTAVASFRRGVAGRIMFQQALEDPYEDVSIYLELAHVSTTTSNDHNWHVHEFPLSWESQSCSSAGGHFNPHSVPTVGNYTRECSPSNPLRCEAGDYAGKHRPVTLLAPSPARYLFTDSSTSLTGTLSIIGRSVVIHGPEGASPRVACANILLLMPLEGQSGPWFGPGDASGMLWATQISDLDPTTVQVDFQGLKGLAGGFHIHLLPVTPGSDTPCSDAQIQGHFNPFGVAISSSPAAGNGSDDQYEVGDISGRRGNLLALDNTTGQFQDTNLPLIGHHSILGRSLVIHYANGSRMQCTTFQSKVAAGGEWVRASATFSGEISGTITMSQIVHPGGRASDTTIIADLQSPALDKSSALNWSVRTDSRTQETYNPYEVPDQGWCSPQRPRLCKAGDLTGRHGSLTPGKRLLLTDANLPLGGDFTVLGRIVAIAWGNAEQATPLLPDVPIATLRIQGVEPFNRSAFQEAVSAALEVLEWKVTLLPMAPEEEGAGPCQRIKFFVIGFNDLAALSALQRREMLGPFCTRCCLTEPMGSGAPLVPPTLLLLMMILSPILLLLLPE